MHTFECYAPSAVHVVLVEVGQRWQVLFRLNEFNAQKGQGCQRPRSSTGCFALLLGVGHLWLEDGLVVALEVGLERLGLGLLLLGLLGEVLSIIA